jgi:hypothetical protein
MRGIEVNVLTLFLYLFVSVRCNLPDIDPFRFCSMLNPDCFICMDCCDSPWLFAIQAFYFAEDIILFHQNLNVNFVIIIKLHAVFACCIEID